MGKKRLATLTFKQLSKLGRTKKNKRPNDIGIRTSRDETGARPIRYFDRDSSHIKKEIIKGKYSGKNIANAIPEPRTHVSVGKQKVPIEHTEMQKYSSAGGTGSRRIFKKEFAPLYTPYHARQFSDAPVIQDLYSKYGISKFMGRPLERLTNKTVQRILNKERTAKGYDPISVHQVTSAMSAALKEIPNVPLRTNHPLTRGRIKKEKEIENYLKGKDPVTKQPRYLSAHTRDLAKDPRFSVGTPRATEETINRIRKSHNPPLEKTISRYGTPKGTDKTTASISPTGRLKQAVDHFTKKNKSQKFNLIKSRRQKREQQLNNIVLNNLSPELRKTAEKILNRGTTFMQALHETFSMHRKPEMAKALSTWVRNMKHSTAEHNVRKLRKMRKEANDPDRKRDIDFELAGWDDDMAAVGVQSNIDGVIYGKWYDQSKSFIRPLVEDLPREYPLKQMKFLNTKTQKMEKTKFSGMNEGGIVEGYSKGGVIKDILSGAAQMSRRKFLKGSGALAASTALPMRTVAKVLPKVAVKEASRFAPPWVKSMIGVLDNLGDGKNFMSHTMSNGTKIKTLGGTKDDYRGKMTPFEVTNSDGYKVPVNMFKEKDGNLHIEFDIRDDFNNNQHIYMDKKTGQVEIVDENYYMTGPEDFAKDDPLVWDATTPTQMQEFERKMGLMRGDGSDYIKDYMSTPEGGDYSDLFESFIDSFSPAGNIFHTKANAKKLELKKLQKKEADEMNWEEQFRGGNMHSFKRGGITPKSKPQQPNMDFNRVLNAMQMVESSNNPQARGPLRRTAIFADPSSDRPRERHEKAHGLFQILPSTARQPGYGVTPFKNFNITSDSLKNNTGAYDPAEQRRFAGDYMQAMLNKFDNNYEKAISAYFYGPGNVEKGEYNLPTYYDKVMKHYNSGGIARRPGAVPPEKGPDPLGYSIKNMGEQFIKKMAKGGAIRKIPKVLGKLTDYRAKISGEVDQMYQTPKGPYTITNDHGAAVLDRTFDTLDETNVALKEMVKGFKTQDATTFRVFGQRPPKTPEGVSESAPEVDMSMVGKVIPPEEPGAMFWNSREKIINAPSEAMQANQWLDFMKRGKHGILNPRGLPIIKDQELNDTSLAPYLSQMGKQIISKEKLVKEFDEMAPSFNVLALGDATGAKVLSTVERSLNKIDTQAIRNPKVKGFFDYMKTVINPLKEADKDQKEVLGNKINEMVERNFGIKNALEEGVPQRFPFEVKEVLSQVSTALGKRSAGFSKYERSPVHEGTQTLGGGDNYREFLFTHKPGKLRSSEPNYTYAHEFGMERGQRAGGVVHTRVSDRTDQFGRRIMHIEEIQSDMHQQINMAQRALKKQDAVFKEQGLTPKQAYNKMSASEKKTYDDLVKSSKYAPRQDVKLKKEINANEQQMRLIQSKIEDLLTKPQNKATQIRLVRLNKERAKIRRILEEEKTKLAESTDTTGIPEGPLRKSEDYNEFVIKYLLRVAEEGGYDGLSISTPAIKNLSLRPGSRDFVGNLTAYGPIAGGAMKKAAKKVGAKFMKTAIVDNQKRGWEIPMILLKENKTAKDIIKKGTPIYKKGGSVKGKK